MLNKFSTVDNDHQLRPEVGGAATGSNGFMLFGVRVMEGSFRKSFSMNNLAQYDEKTHQESSNDIVATGYVSDDVVHPSGRTHGRKRGVPWSEEEHKLFLLGLQNVGKGDWRGISKNFVKTRTPTQVASHAQKYFLRRNNYNRRRRRSSLFDITTDAVSNPPVHEQMYQESLPQLPTPQPKQLNKKVEMFPPASPVVAITPLEPLTNEIAVPLGQLNRLKSSPKLMRPIPILPSPPSSEMANLDLRTMEPSSLSLNLSISLNSPPPPSNQESTHVRHAMVLEALSESFSGGGKDSIISVA